MIDTIRFRKRMLELQLNQEDIAAKMGISQSTLNLKLNNIRAMKLSEAEKLQEILLIPDKEFHEYFFCN